MAEQSQFRRFEWSPINHFQPLAGSTRNQYQVRGQIGDKNGQIRDKSTNISTGRLLGALRVRFPISSSLMGKYH